MALIALSRLRQMNTEHDEDMTERNNRIKFDPTVNLGHVLTFVGFIVAGFGAWATLDKRLVILEENRRTQVLVDQNQDQRVGYMNETVQALLARIEGQVTRLNDRLDSQAPTERRNAAP